jgi:hypothetical protein
MKIVQPHFFAHASTIMAREAHAPHDVGFEQANPIFIRNFLERFLRKCPCYRSGRLLCELLGSISRNSIRKISSHTRDIGAGMSFSDFGDGGVYAFLRSLATTDAPSAVSTRPVAGPIPAVEPVTNALLSSNCRSMLSFSEILASPSLSKSTETGSSLITDAANKTSLFRRSHYYSFRISLEIYPYSLRYAFISF